MRPSFWHLIENGQVLVSLLLLENLCMLMSIKDALLIFHSPPGTPIQPLFCLYQPDKIHTGRMVCRGSNLMLWSNIGLWEWAQITQRSGVPGIGTLTQTYEWLLLPLRGHLCSSNATQCLGNETKIGMAGRRWPRWKQPFQSYFYITSIFSYVSNACI